MSRHFYYGLIVAALTVNAKYSAYNYYQFLKGRPLSGEEMDEIATVVVHDIGNEAARLLKEYAPSCTPNKTVN